MTDESDGQRRLRLIAQRDLPDRPRRPSPTPALDELAGLVASQAALQARLEAWIDAAASSERALGERIVGIERLGKRVISETRRAGSDVADRLHALIADERVRRAEHARVVDDCARQAMRLEEARAAILAIAGKQSRWMALAGGSTVATLILAVVVGLRIGGA